MENLELTVKCCNCDCEVELPDANEIDDQFYCDECKDDLFTLCGFCDEYHENNDMQEYTDRYRNTDFACPSCTRKYLTKCDDCGDYFEDNAIYTDSNNTGYCESCRENYYICEDCGIYISGDEIYGEDNIYCESCYEDNKPDNEVIHGYGYKPEAIFHGKSLIQYGLEVETDKGDDKEDYANDLYELSDDEDIFYLKEDGSLDDGVEIVTHPCSLDYHLNHFPWSEVMDTAKNHDFKSHDAITCGLHIHVSRKAFGLSFDEQEKNIAKLLFLVNNNWEDMVQFSRRTETQLSRWASRYSQKNMTELLEEGKMSGRYMAINLQNSNTVKFRLFRGTLKVETLYATLELVDLIVKSSVNISIADLYQSRLSELIEASTNYTYLKEYCAVRKIINPAA